MSKAKQRITRTVLERTPVWLSLDNYELYEFWRAEPRWDVDHWRQRGRTNSYIMEWDGTDFEAFSPSLRLKPGQCVRCVKIDTDKGFILERDE